MSASAILQDVDLKTGDYSDVIDACRPGDLVYFDPPYVPISKYADFRRYHRDFFGLEDHRRLAADFANLAERGCYVMLSNSDTDFVRSLYSDWHLTRVAAPRSISSNGKARSSVSELVITSYAPSGEYLTR
jgi:DNA adenine methylase